MVFICDGLCRWPQDISGWSRGGAFDLQGKKSRWLCEKTPRLPPSPLSNFSTVPTSLTSPLFIVRSRIYRPCRLTKTQMTYYLLLNIVLVFLTSAHFKMENLFFFREVDIRYFIYQKQHNTNHVGPEITSVLNGFRAM